MIVFKIKKIRGKQDLPGLACKKKTLLIKNKINPIKTNIYNQKIYLEFTSRVLKMQVIMVR